MTLAIDGGTPVRTAPLPLAKGMAAVGDEEEAAVVAVLRSRSLFRYYGPDLQGTVAGFEAAVAERLGCAHAVAVSSGTAALRVALAALGVGCGDEVIVPAFTFIATVNAVVLAGAVPVFAEVDDTLNLDAASVAAARSSRTVAVVPVHLENVPCDMDPLLDAARGLAVLEDTAQSMGVTYRGRALGTIGDIGAFSLQLDKNITAGEGGVVVTNDAGLHLRGSRYQDQGGQFTTKYGLQRGTDLGDGFVGENLRMTELSGAVAGVQLGRLDTLLASMSANARRIEAAVGQVDGFVARRRPDPAPEAWGGSSLTWFAPTPAVAERVVGALRAEGVPAARIYDGQPVYATPSILGKRTVTSKGGPWHCAEHPCHVDYRMGLCPQTEDRAARSFSVGVGPGFTAADCDDVAEALLKVLPVM